MTTTATQIVEYNVSKESITKLVEEHNITAIETKEDYKKVQRGLAALRTVRVSVEAKRKDLKKDALEYGRRVDSVAKELTVMIVAGEDPLKLLKAEVDNKEANRIAKIDEHIKDLTSILDKVDDMDSKALQVEMDDMASLGLTKEMFQEKLEEAEEMRAAVVKKLSEHIIAAKEDEDAIAAIEAKRVENAAAEKKLADDRAAFEAEQAEAAAKAKVDADKVEAERRAFEDDRRKSEEEARVKAKVESDRVEAERRKLETERLQAEQVKRAESDKKLLEANEKIKADIARREAEKEAARLQAEKEAEDAAEAALAPDREKMVAFAAKLKEEVTSVTVPLIEDEHMDKLITAELKKIHVCINTIWEAGK